MTSTSPLPLPSGRREPPVRSVQNSGNFVSYYGPVGGNRGVTFLVLGSSPKCNETCLFLLYELLDVLDNRRVATS